MRLQLTCVYDDVVEGLSFRSGVFFEFQKGKELVGTGREKTTAGGTLAFGQNIGYVV